MTRGQRRGLETGLGGWIVVPLVALCLALLAPAVGAQQRGSRVAAATENLLSTKAALAQMRAGGNAVDAMVTAALVGGVASPTSSGIGGGGFCLVWLAQERKVLALDFRETAPKNIDVAAFESRPFGVSTRGKYVGVPGEVAGLFELHRRLGKRPWKDVVEPAVRAAKNGFAVNPHLGAMLGAYAKDLRVDAGIDGVFYPKGKPGAVGSLLVNEKLGRTLERLAAEGPKAVYEGSVAADIVASANKVGGALSTEELTAYKPVERKPLHVRWEGYDVYTMPAPSAGGLLVAQTLKLFGRAELEKLKLGSGAYQHVLAEAMRGAIGDRMRYFGDPSFEKLDVDALLSDARMARRKKTIALDRTHAAPRFGLEEHGTHHLVTADADGNFVTLTTTVNRVFGAKISSDDAGVVLNDELDDFTKQKDVQPFGMKQSPNRPRPGARPISSMSPTLVVKDGQVVLAIGGSGGTTIPTNVAQLLLGRLAFGKQPSELVKMPRFYVPTSGPTILVEKGASEELRKDLAWRGEVVATMPFTSSGVQMIAVERGRKLPASDPRKHGSALAE
jgi:gamma-glutamyltranspeptidase/glutathione hydrolase